MDWKTHRDEFYRELEENYGPALVKEAGFFHDTSPSHQALDDVGIPTTPTAHLSRDAVSRPAVILLTGSLCPVHEGHIEIMKQARSAVTAAGFHVIGGYLSPGHDEYITSKVGDRGISASRRVAMASRATYGTWIDADPWEALHRSCAVNFTDVIVRLRAYLRHHLQQDVTVVFACGGDNARFALTFAHQGHCVVVSRPGYDDRTERYRRHPLLKDNPRVLWAAGNSCASSTDIRDGNLSHLPDAITGMMGHIPPEHVTLRVEGNKMVPNSIAEFHMNSAMLATRVFHFQEGLEQLLSKNFSGRVRRVHLESQVLESESIARNKLTVSLDPMIPGQHNFAISREFDAGGYRQLGYAPRPGTGTFDEQVAQLPEKPFFLFDDDIVSGGTVKAVAALIGREHISGALCLETSQGGIHEVVDCRDFLLGGHEAGLVVRLPSGHLCRMPYVFPLVDPTVRASIRPSLAATFSRQVWHMNAEFYAGTDIRIEHLPNAARLGLAACGFPDSELVTRACLALREKIP